MDIIMLAVVVVFIILRLRNVLGTRPENAMSEESARNLFDLIVKESSKQAGIIDTEATIIGENGKPVSGLERVLAEIPLFNKEKFLNSAKKAFEIILAAFAKGDIETLKMLVHKDLLKKFEEIAKERAKEGITGETDFIGFENAEITDAKLSKSGIAKIAVKFVTEQMNILKNAKGEIIEGDENYIQNITDVWTFERNINSGQPNWLLVSTKK